MVSPATSHCQIVIPGLESGTGITQFQSQITQSKEDQWHAGRWVGIQDDPFGLEGAQKKVQCGRDKCDETRDGVKCSQVGAMLPFGCFALGATESLEGPSELSTENYERLEKQDLRGADQCPGAADLKEEQVLRRKGL